MDSSIWQRFRGQLPIVALGLATPLLALTALVVRPGSESRREVVTVASDRTPTPTPVPRTGPTTTFLPLAPEAPEVPTSGGPPETLPAEGSEPTPSRSGEVRPKGTAPTTKKTTSTTPTPGGSKTGGTTSSGSSGSGTGGGSGGGGSGGGSSGGTGGGSSTTTAPPSNIVFSDAMSYNGSWSSGAGFGPWTVRSDGGGEVTGSGGAVVATPAAPGPGEKNTAIVTTGNFGDLDLTVVLSTVTVLPGGGGSGDAASILWHYADSARHYAFRVGPGGWAVVLVDPGEAGGRRNLAEGSSPSAGVGSNVTVRVRQVGSTISAYVGGSLVAVVNDSSHSAGAIGLAATNASGRFDQVTVRST